MYCTYLVTYIGNKLPMFYIGSTSVENIRKGYMGSVSSKRYKNIWVDELKVNPNLFKLTIISRHDTRQEAFDKEDKLQRYVKVKNNPMYINMCYAIDNNDCSGENNPMYGKVRTDAKRRMTENNPMKDQATVDKMKATRKLLNKPAHNKGLSNPYQKEKMTLNNPMKNEDICNKMLKTKLSNNGGVYPCAGTIWVANRVTKQRKRVSPIEFNDLDETWIRLGNKQPIPDLPL